MKFLHTQNIHTSKFSILSVLLLSSLWFFGNVSFASATTLSGVLYTDAGVTTAPSGKTIRVAVGTSTPTVYSTTTTSGGAWIFTAINFTGVSSTTPMTVWLDGDSNKATTLVAGYTGSPITATPLYYEHLVTYGAASTSVITMGNFPYDSSNDADVLYANRNGIFGVVTNKDFIVKQGVVVSADRLTISGNFKNEGTFIGLDKSLVLNGSGKTLDGFLFATSSLGDVIVYGSYSALSNASTTNFVILEGGEFTNNVVLTVYGRFLNLGTYFGDGGNLHVEASRPPLSFAAGRDSAGATSGGTNALAINSLLVSGNNLYVAKAANSTGCSQGLNSAFGCEFMVYDISSSTSPVYVAGRDSSGSNNGTAAQAANALATAGNSVYVGKPGNGTACSQTAGSAIGCEILVFNVSSTTNPIYAAGRDVSGNAAGTGNKVINSMVVSGNYLYVGTAGNATACSQTAGSAIGCEILVFNVSSTTNPIYAAGRDVSGSAAGTGNKAVTSMVVSGNYLYVGTAGNATACSQTAGSAIGCEFIVFDISSSTNPIFRAGRDASGNSTGVENLAVNSLAVLDSTVYVATAGNVTACSQTAGSAIGCELVVFDISSSTNPIFRAGRDATGDSAGTGNINVNSVTTLGNYLYVGKNNSPTACSQTAGFAIGCELMVFDISSTTNPIYSSGRDVTGGTDGVGDLAINVLATVGNYLFAGKTGDSTTCSQVVGSAIGCEIMLFDNARIPVPGHVSGNLQGSSALGNFYTAGAVLIDAELASTSDLTISSGVFTAPSYLTVAGDYQNNALANFSNANTVYFDSDSSQLLGGSLEGGSALPHVSFLGDGSKTLPSAVVTKDFTLGTGVTVTAGASLEVKGDYTNSGTFQSSGNELYINLLLKDYIAGQDVSGDASGTGDLVNINSFVVVGNYLYVGKSGNATACSQTAGSAIGCELMVFDISSTTNPAYVAGRDAGGSTTGIVNQNINSLVVVGNYLYIAKGSNATACSQAAGSAIGCELMVFDISSSTNPVYVAGRDASGSAAGTGATTIQTLLVVGNFLYAGKTGNATACSQAAGSAIGCELMVFDISSSTDPAYVAGRDASGSAAGTGNLDIITFTVTNGYLYVGKAGATTACSQAAGSAIGCELMVFDISSSTDPAYVAGRDVNGSSNGNTSLSINSLAAAGSYLYAGKTGNATACSQAAGSAIGCELMVFDISSSTDPAYVAGRDVSGNTDGTENLNINSLTISGNYLYLGTAGNATACSQAAGSAIGCELQIYNIGNPLNPTYAGGRDSTSNATGEGAVSINFLTTNGGYLYVAKTAEATACSRKVGLAIGCEVQVYPIQGAEVRGNLVDSSALNDVVIGGIGAEFYNNTETNDIEIKVGSILQAPAVLTVGGSITNNNAGVFSHRGGEVVLAGNNEDVIGSFVGDSAFNHLRVTGSYEMVSTAASTTNLTIENGASFVASDHLSVYRNLHNEGTYTNNGGVLYVGNPDHAFFNYVAGRNVDGTGSGNAHGGVRAFASTGNYLFVGSDVYYGSCDGIETDGCELKVFDISEPSNPVLIATRNTDGGATGFTSARIQALAISGTTLYVGREGDGTACSQTPGAADGCEIQVYDIINPANPTYVAGRDASGGAAGTASVNVYSLEVIGNSLYVGKSANPTACSQVAGSAIGCELMVFDITSPTNPVYVAGRDHDGSSTGTTGDWEEIYDFVVVGEVMYLVRGASGECGPGPGNGAGCSMQIYNVSSTTNPIYLGGRLADAQSSGETWGADSYALAVAGETLYIGKGGDGSYCLTAPQGCELQMYDISSSTNPTYVGGLDSGGMPDGSSEWGQGIFGLTVHDEYLYVVKQSGRTICTQLVGLAAGCEFQAYDISSTTRPIFVAGQDVHGDRLGQYIDNTDTYAVHVANGHVFFGRRVGGPECSQVPGEAAGCQITVFEASSAGLISGAFSGASALGDVRVLGGTTALYGIASTSDLILENEYFLPNYSDITVSGNYTNTSAQVMYSRFNNLYFSSPSAQAISGAISGASTLPNVTLLGAGTKTFVNNATTTDLVIGSTATLIADGPLTVKGSLLNAGTFAISHPLELAGIYENSGSVTISGATQISASPFAHYTAGIDGSGSPTGTTNSVHIRDFEVVGDYLYVAKNSEGPCSSVPGSASGCALQVYNVADPANPYYVTGRNSYAGSGGDGYGESFYAVASKDNFLYVAGINYAENEPCNQSLSPNSGGCDILIFNISSSTNPTYTGGMDVSGLKSGSEGGIVVRTLTVAGDQLFVGTNGDRWDPPVPACSSVAGEAEGCEIQIYDISSSTNPVFLSGRDANASATGDTRREVNSIAAQDGYMYVGLAGNGTACSQSAGSAEGCELQIYDISNPINPVYVAGRDVDGTASGSENAHFKKLLIDGGLLYVAQGQYYSDCNDVDIAGCHVKWFDISDPTDPTYVGGVSGYGALAYGSGLSVNSIALSNQKLYLTKDYTAGVECNVFGRGTETEGCELLVYDVASSTNPVFLSARDSSSGEVGYSNVGLGPLKVIEDYLYIGVTQNSLATPCSSATGRAQGCEIQVYRTTPSIGGSMTGSNAFGDVTVSGVGSVFTDSVDVDTFTILHGAVTAPVALTVSGDFINNNGGTFNANSGEVILSGDDQIVLGTTTFFDLTKQPIGAATTTFEAGSLTTVLNEWTFSGASPVVQHALISSDEGEYWYINASSTTLSNLAVRDSNNLNVSTVICGFGCLDNTNNVNWSFELVGAVTALQSTEPHTFYFSQPTTTLGTIMVTEGSPTNITTTDDIRITIATSTTDFRFDVGTTQLSFEGTAAGKVSNTVSYENDGATLVINVTTNFTAEDVLVINGVKVGSFAAVSAETSVLALHTDGTITSAPVAIDTQPIRILGALILEDHPAGQVGNRLGVASRTDEPLFAFSVQTIGEQTLVEDLTLSLIGLGSLTGDNLLNFRLYRDSNNDRQLDGGDVLIDGSGILTINGQHGAVTFSTDFVASTSASYIIVADTNNIARGSSVNLMLMNNAFAGVGSISGLTPIVVSTLSSIQHIRLNAGTAGGAVGVGRVDGNVTPGAGTESGGGSGGGAPAEQTDGENIAPSANFYKPTSSGSPHNEWTNGANALQSDGNFASASGGNLRQSYAGFPFAIPTENSIEGIGIKIDASGSTPAGTIDVALSWDGGESYTTGKATPTLTGSDVVYTVGGASDLWGRTWIASDFAPEVFRVRVTASPDGNTLRLDALEIRVYHQTSGGGSGGGGGGRS